jgi:hypothetical protein
MIREVEKDRDLRVKDHTLWAERNLQDVFYVDHLSPGSHVRSQYSRLGYSALLSVVNNSFAVIPQKIVEEVRAKGPKYPLRSVVKDLLSHGLVESFDDGKEDPHKEERCPVRIEKVQLPAGELFEHLLAIDHGVFALELSCGRCVTWFTETQTIVDPQPSLGVLPIPATRKNLGIMKISACDCVRAYRMLYYCA